VISIAVHSFSKSIMFVQRFFLSLSVLTSLVVASSEANQTSENIVFDPLQYVDPLIGTAKDGENYPPVG
jgi:hypothetical protein